MAGLDLAHLTAEGRANFLPSATLESRVIDYINDYAFNIEYVHRIGLGSSLLMRALCYCATDAQLPLMLPYDQAKKFQHVIKCLTTCLVKTIADMMPTRCALRHAADEGPAAV